MTGAHEVSTDRKALENSRLLAAIIKHSNDAIVAKTLDGTITCWNPAAAKM